MIKMGNDIDWTQGHITPWWNSYDFKNINYRKGNTDTEQAKTWTNMGFCKENLYGSMYDASMEKPKWVKKFESIFPWKHFGWTLYKMEPGEVIPWHRDMFLKYIEIHKIKNFNSILRAIVFLEDWKSGHYIEVKETPITKWQKGDFVIWKYDTDHIASNIGYETRYTLQLTGVYE